MSAMDNYEHLLSVQNLHTSFFTGNGEVKAVNGVSFNLDKGKVLGIVGESGSGKSVTAYSVMQILAETGRITEGAVLYKGDDITKWSEKQMSEFRGGGWMDDDHFLHSAALAMRHVLVDHARARLAAKRGAGKIDALLDVMRPYGILEMGRTGVVAMSRGAEFFGAQSAYTATEAIAVNFN